MVPINELPVDARLLAEHSPAGGRSLPYLRGRLKSPVQPLHAPCLKAPGRRPAVGANSFSRRGGMENLSPSSGCGRESSPLKLSLIHI